MAGGGQRRPRRAARAVPWGGEAAAGEAAAAAGSFAAQASDRATGHTPHHASSRRWGRGARPRRARAGRRSAVARRLSFARQLPPLGAVAGVDGQNGEGRRQRRGVGLGEKGGRRVGGREAWAGERPSSNPASRPPASQRGDAPRRRSPARGVRSRFPPFCATSSGGGRARGQPGASGRSRSVARGWVGIGRGRRAVEAVSERARRRPSALGARPRSREPPKDPRRPGARAQGACTPPWARPATAAGIRRRFRSDPPPHSSNLSLVGRPGLHGARRRSLTPQGARDRRPGQRRGGGGV